MSSEGFSDLNRAVSRLARLVTSDALDLEDRLRAGRAILRVLEASDLALGNQVAEQIESRDASSGQEARPAQESHRGGLGQKFIAVLEWADYVNPLSPGVRPRRR